MMEYGLIELNASPAPELLFSVAEAKQHLRVDISDDDDEIERKILSATRHAEQYTSRAFVSRQFKLTIDYFPSAYGGGRFPQAIDVPIAPLVSVDEISYQSTELSGGSPVAKTVTGVADTTRQPPRIVPQFQQTWPDVSDVPSAVEITITAGYGGAEDVPADIKEAVKLILGSFYEHREEQVVGTIATRMPFAAREVLSTYRVIGL